MTRVLLLIFMLGAAPLQAASYDWTPQGEVRGLATLAEEKEGISPHQEIAETALRAGIEGRGNGIPDLEIAFDLATRHCDPPLPLFDGVSLRDTAFEDRTTDGYWQRSIALDRFNLHHGADRFDLTLGRQAIGFGRMVLSSPLDMIAPFAPDAINTSHRPGVDALRLNLYDRRGDALGVTAIRGGDKSDDSLIATSVLVTPLGDVLLLGGDVRGAACYGGGMAGELAGVGIRGEYVRCDPEDEGTIKRGGVEFWWHGESDLDLMVAWLHNGLADDPADYPATALSSAVREGVTPLLGNDYLLASLSYPFHPLVDGNLLMIRNLEDDSILLQPRISLSLGDNLAALLFATIHRGEKPEQHPFLPVTLPQSEFGSRPDRYGCQLTYSF